MALAITDERLLINKAKALSVLKLKIEFEMIVLKKSKLLIEN